MSASQRIILIAPGTIITASGGPGSGVPVPTLSQLMIGINCTAVTGTTPVLTMWLVGSADGGTTFFDIPTDRIMNSSTAAANPSTFLDRRNIMDGVASPIKMIAIFQTLPADIIGLQYVVSGSSPQFTLGAWAVGK